MGSRRGTDSVAAFDVFRAAGFAAAPRSGRTADAPVATTLGTGNLTVIITAYAVRNTATRSTAHRELGEAFDAVVAANVQGGDAVPAAALLVGLATTVLAALFTLQAARSMATGFIRGANAPALTTDRVCGNASCLATSLTIGAAGASARDSGRKTQSGNTLLTLVAMTTLTCD